MTGGANRTGRVLVTGAAGFVGSHLLPALASRGLHVAALDRTPPEVSLTHKQEGRVDWLQADLVTDNLAAMLRGVEVVYHLAARFLPGTSDRILEELNNLNVVGTQRLAQACAASGVRRFVHVSSVAASDVGPSLLVDESGKPSSSYGESKLQSELALQAVAGDRFQCAILRPTALFGENHLGSVYEMASAIARRRFVIVGDGSNHVNFLYVGDLVEVLCEAGLGATLNGSAVIVADEPITLRALARKMRSELGLAGEALALPRWTGLGLGVLADAISTLSGRSIAISSRRVRAMTRDVCYSSAALKRCGVSPLRYGLELGLSRTMRWYREQELL